MGSYTTNFNNIKSLSSCDIQQTQLYSMYMVQKAYLIGRFSFWIV